MTATDRSRTTTFTTPTDREIVMVRAFHAPRSLVFNAWTRCEHVRHWMGPHGWTMPDCQIDLRPGGTWRFCLAGPDGAGVGMGGVYQEIDAPERIVTTEYWDGFPGEWLNTLVLAEAQGLTTATTTILCDSQEARDAMLATEMKAGVVASYERLDDHIARVREDGA